MRPPGPEPVRSAGSMPFSSASLRARGEILMRPPSRFAGAAGAAAGFAAGWSDAGAALGSTAGRASVSFFDVVDAPSAAGFASSSAFFAGAGAAAFGAGVSTFSPSLPIAQSGSPMATCEPSAAKIFSSLPSKKLSSSIVALSVSTSASMSPDFTSSPSFFSHLTSVPTVMVSLSFGISMMLGIAEGEG